MLSKTIAVVPFVASTILAALGLVGCSGAVAPDPTKTGTEGQALEHRASDAPPLPSPALAVPAGNELAFHFDAVGVQIYTCAATATGFAWTFVAPEATLYREDHVVGKHYAGPTWEYEDGSKVVGAKVAGATPDPTSIPWLLLRAVSHAGSGKMTPVTYIQRLETTGGLAPATGCDATTVGAGARVPYTATYYFAKADDAAQDD
jgi:hypothetical protein